MKNPHCLQGFVSAVITTAVLLAFRHDTGFAQEGQSLSPTVEESAAGAGSWESSRDDQGKRNWQVQIERFSDNTIAGSVIVVGSTYMNKARLEGRVEGKDVYGVMVGEDNQQIGTFVGNVTETGLSGSYTTNQGDTGSWSWAGTAAARALASDGTENAAAQ